MGLLEWCLTKMLFCFHRWGEWVQEKTAEILDQNHAVVGVAYFQHRTCEKCKFVQRKVERIFAAGY